MIDTVGGMTDGVSVVIQLHVQYVTFSMNLVEGFLIQIATTLKHLQTACHH